VRALKRLIRWLTRAALLIGGPLAIAIAGLYFYMSSGRYVTTENAYVKADLIIVTPEISGRVIDVAVDDNQNVKPGAVLFRLDPQRFEVTRARRAAELAAARQHVVALKARHKTKLAELAAAEADEVFWAEELERSRRLRQRGTISEFRLIEVRRAHQQAETRCEVIKQEIAEALTELGGDPDMPVDQHPDVMRALAELRRDRLNAAARELLARRVETLAERLRRERERQADSDLEATIVRAPAASITANLKLQVGEYVEEGDAVMSLVGTDAVWVEANLKETDLTHLKVGQEAELEVDAYPGVVLTARVASLSPATGAEYALLPPQNAYGNWIKVVQRVPVRLEIAPREDGPQLRAGMSVAVSMDTEYQRPLPDVLSKARAWILQRDGE